MNLLASVGPPCLPLLVGTFSKVDMANDFFTCREQTSWAQVSKPPKASRLLKSSFWKSSRFLYKRDMLSKAEVYASLQGKETSPSSFSDKKREWKTDCWQSEEEDTKRSSLMPRSALRPSSQFQMMDSDKDSLPIRIPCWDGKEKKKRASPSSLFNHFTTMTPLKKVIKLIRQSKRRSRRIRKENKNSHSDIPSKPPPSREFTHFRKHKRKKVTV